MIEYRKLAANIQRALAELNENIAAGHEGRVTFRIERHRGEDGLERFELAEARYNFDLTEFAAA